MGMGSTSITITRNNGEISNEGITEISEEPSLAQLNEV